MSTLADLTPDEMKILRAALEFTMADHIAERRDRREGDDRSAVESEYGIDGWDLIRLAVKLGVAYDPFDYGLGEIPPKP